MNVEVDREAYRHRIKLVRKIHRLNQMQFARLLDIPYKRWNHYECGFLCTRESAFILRQHFGVSTDWLWFGDEANMPDDLMRRIRRIEREERKAAKDQRPQGLPAVRKRISKGRGE